MDQAADRRATTLPRRRIFVRDLVLQARIGIHAHERHAPQRIRINLTVAMVDDGELAASRPGRVDGDPLARTIDYAALAQGVRDLVAAGHIALVETLAERIAELTLADARVREVQVAVEKLDVFEDAGSVGVEIERRQ